MEKESKIEIGSGLEIPPGSYLGNIKDDFNKLERSQDKANTFMMSLTGIIVGVFFVTGILIALDYFKYSGERYEKLIFIKHSIMKNIGGAYLPELNQKVQDLLFSKDKSIVDDWMVGKYTAREINKLISEKTGIPFDYLWEVFVNDCKSMTVPMITLNKISSLRTKFITILITVNMDSFSEFTSPALKLDRYFDYISNSFQERKHKNDNGGIIFTEYSKKLGVPINQSFLIDDSDSVCKTFKSLGGTVYQVSKEKDIDYYLDILKVEKI